MAVNPLQRFYPFDVGALTLFQTATTYDYTDLFQDNEITLEFDSEQSVAATDVASATGGFEYNVNKARGYTVRLGTVLGAPASGISGRKFGWDLTALSWTPSGGSAIDLLDMFTVARVRVSKTFTEVRAARDRVNLLGWKYPRVKSNRLEVDLEALVNGLSASPDSAVPPELLELGIDASAWALPVSYAVTGGGLVLVGNGTLSAAGFGHSGDETKQTATLVCQGLPTTSTETSGSAVILKRALSNATFALTMTRPGGSVYTGDVYLEEGSLEAPDGACLQGATLRGFGPLLPT